VHRLKLVGLLVTVAVGQVLFSLLVTRVSLTTLFLLSLTVGVLGRRVFDWLEKPKAPLD
jgi:hypothetical protein